MLGSRPLARPALPPLDPLGALVPGVVPEKRRFCSSCDQQLKRDSGFCSKCGQEYSFIPTLAPGDLVADKYEIKGTIAFGGLGWIYLALDTMLNRWVTMKGLLNSKDPRMLEVAVQEREFLAAVKHPNIVGIYDFITHGEEGFIVMEYVNGKTLMTLRKEHGGPLPVAEAISYIAEILPALGYLDEMGLVYCDFKPENVMVEEETVKLIDLGAVRRVDDTGGDIYGSRGYTAPEAHEQPTPVSDLYGAARALAVLVASFDFQSAHESSLPTPEECEVFAKNEALYRFLLKATRPNPAERFQTAAEMAEQLVGVLRTVAGASADLGPAESSIFEYEGPSSTDAPGPAMEATRAVPRLKVDKEDAAANLVTAAAALPDAQRRRDLLLKNLRVFPASIELKLRLVDELITLGELIEAERRLDQAQTAAPNDWRLGWYRGRKLLAEGKPQESLRSFQIVVDDMPGELAPRQALGRVHETLENLDAAISHYDTVSKTDPSYVASSFGLARCLVRKKDRAGAAAALRRVPPSSSRHAQAQQELARLLIDDDPSPPTIDELLQASEAVEALEGVVDGIEFRLLRADVLLAASRNATARKGGSGAVILKIPLATGALLTAAELELRQCARMSTTEHDRIMLVDEANRIRPMTLT
jgi:serine/threonine-protein kinase PknG